MLGCEKNSERMWWTGYGNYAGLVGHGDFGPCIVWNDAVSGFVHHHTICKKCCSPIIREPVFYPLRKIQRIVTGLHPSIQNQGKMIYC